jgi:hypothetical protein
MQKESEQTNEDTHSLESIEGGTSQGTERQQASKENSRAGEHKGKDKSGHERT